MHGQMKSDGDSVMSVFTKSRGIALMFIATFCMSVYAEEVVEPLYDASGNVVQSVDDNETEIQSEYDANGELIREYFDDGRTFNYNSENGALEE
jgi:YD repeat-containing protein